MHSCNFPRAPRAVCMPSWYRCETSRGACCPTSRSTTAVTRSVPDFIVSGGEFEEVHHILALSDRASQPVAVDACVDWLERAGQRTHSLQRLSHPARQSAESIRRRFARGRLFDQTIQGTTLSSWSAVDAGVTQSTHGESGMDTRFTRVLLTCFSSRAPLAE